MNQKRIDVVCLRCVFHQLGYVGWGSLADSGSGCHGDADRDQPTGALVGANHKFACSGCFGVQGRQGYERQRYQNYSVGPEHCYYLLMEHAGFVLAGGRSTRMGRDKALLPWNGGTLLDHVAGVVREAVGNVTVIGRGEHPDVVPDCGPLGGLLTAFAASSAERVLLVACDMPNLTAELLRGLAETPGDAVVAETNGRLHPLCAVYSRKLEPEVALAIERKSLKMHDFLSRIQVKSWPVSDAMLLKNLNTPEDFAA